MSIRMKVDSIGCQETIVVNSTDHKKGMWCEATNKVMAMREHYDIIEVKLLVDHDHKGRAH